MSQDQSSDVIYFFFFFFKNPTIVPISVFEPFILFFYDVFSSPRQQEEKTTADSGKKQNMIRSGSDTFSPATMLSLWCVCVCVCMCVCVCVFPLDQRAVCVLAEVWVK